VAATCLQTGNGQVCGRRVQECHCMLFLTEDNDFRGEDNKIALEEVVEATKGLSGVQG
jgi:ferredoxin-thioredoxin reductase catalytic subunit